MVTKQSREGSRGGHAWRSYQLSFVAETTWSPKCAAGIIYFFRSPNRPVSSGLAGWAQIIFQSFNLLIFLSFNNLSRGRRGQAGPKGAQKGSTAPRCFPVLAALGMLRSGCCRLNAQGPGTMLYRGVASCCTALCCDGRAESGEGRKGEGGKAEKRKGGKGEAFTEQH